mgnify:CR=1 FL=1
MTHHQSPPHRMFDLDCPVHQPGRNVCFYAWLSLYHPLSTWSAVFPLAKQDNIGKGGNSNVINANTAH